MMYLSLLSMGNQMKKNRYLISILLTHDDVGHSGWYYFHWLFMYGIYDERVDHI